MNPKKPSFSLDFTLLKSTRVPQGAFSALDLEALARFALSSEKVRAPVDLTVDLTGHERIRALNRRYRGIDRTTDVISFRDDLSADPAPGRVKVESRRYWALALPAPGQRLQGDLAINVHQAAIQARIVGHALSREVRLLLIHGILHLLGYTDYDPIPRRRMFRRQNALLRRWERLPHNLSSGVTDNGSLII